MSGRIKDCAVTVRDLDVARMIWGKKSVPVLKGKSTRTKPIPVRAETVMIPRELRYLQKSVVLCFDIFFVDTIPFFLSVSRKTNPLHYGLPT